MEMLVPDFRGIFANWPVGVHPDYKPLKEKLELQAIKDSSLSIPALRVFYRVDVSLLTCSYWPDTTSARLQALAGFLIWIGILDDYLEELPRPEPLTTFAVGLSKRIVDVVLYNGNGGVGGSVSGGVVLSGGETVRADAKVDSIMRKFVKMMVPIMDDFASYEQKAAFCGWMTEYINGTVYEDPKAPVWSKDSDQVIKIRSVAGAGGPLLSVMEFAAGVKLPSWVYKTPEYDEMFRAGMHAIALTNDVFSLAKELRADFPCNSLVTHARTGRAADYTAAAAYNARTVASHVAEFDRVAAALVSKALEHSTDEKCAVALDVEKFADAMRLMCTGNMTWSELTKRYSRGGIRGDGTQIVRLG